MPSSWTAPGLTTTERRKAILDAWEANEAPIHVLIDQALLAAHCDAKAAAGDAREKAIGECMEACLRVAEQWSESRRDVAIECRIAIAALAGREP